MNPTTYFGVIMDNQTEEINENLSVKDVIVLTTVATAVIIGVGGLAKLGRDLAEEGLIILKAKKARKNQNKK